MVSKLYGVAVAELKSDIIAVSYCGSVVCTQNESGWCIWNVNMACCSVWNYDGFFHSIKICEFPCIKLKVIKILKNNKQG